MPLQANERAEIERIITTYINATPLHSLGDFSTLTNALKTLTEIDTPVVHNSQIASTIGQISTFMYESDSPHASREFLNCCMEVINANVQRLESLSDAEKQNHIAHQRDLFTYSTLLLMVRHQLSRLPHLEEEARRQEISRTWHYLRDYPRPQFRLQAADELPMERSGLANTANYGEWKRTFDTSHISHATWEKHYGLREENRHCVKHLSLQKKPSHFQLSLESSNHSASSGSRPLSMFEANNLRITLAFAMVRAGITKDTPQVTRFPKTAINQENHFGSETDVLCIRGNALNLLHILHMH